MRVSVGWLRGEVGYGCIMEYRGVYVVPMGTRGLAG